MEKSSFWLGEDGGGNTPEMDDLNIFTFTGFRFIFPAQVNAGQGFESALVLELQ
ncbi:MULTISPECIES: hypothetical protein [Deinococcus]|uniref:hypothetical protein n=1 Tax=Deinococcus TaxID=1298 RepID=UPI0003793B05|nr:MULTISPECIES: hypothetical protein [Deinococcus]